MLSTVNLKEVIESKPGRRQLKHRIMKRWYLNRIRKGQVEDNSPHRKSSICRGSKAGQEVGIGLENKTHPAGVSLSGIHTIRLDRCDKGIFTVAHLSIRAVKL